LRSGPSEVVDERQAAPATFTDHQSFRSHHGLVLVGAMNAFFLLSVMMAGLVVLLAVLARRAERHRAAAQRRAAAAEVEAAYRARSLSLAAQELRGIAVRLAESPVPPPQEVAAGAAPARHLRRLADELAEVAAGPVESRLREAPTRLGPLVDAAIAVVRRQLGPALLHWKVDPALRGLTLRADRTALEGALVALLRRAATHSRDGDVIALRRVVASETVAIVVEDEGDGLGLDDQAPAGPAAPPRLDLGLSLARDLAAAHGGDIRLEAAPGIGARAWLTLPRARLLEPA
jgi:signal transduction histidine kinase